MVAVYPGADPVDIERLVVDTYQAVSGTGHKAVAELQSQIEAHAAGEPKVAKVYPHPIGFNALPHIDVFREDGYTKEEWKVVNENRKILAMPDLKEKGVTLGYRFVGGSPEKLGAFLKSEIAKWAEAVKVSGATVD